MNIKNTEEYKKNLEKERKILIDALAKDEKIEDFGSDVDGFDEEKNEAEQIGNQLAAGQTLKERISEIDTAINKILEGKYGICEKCGDKISDDVLRVSPESRLCKNCKKNRV